MKKFLIVFCLVCLSNFVFASTIYISEKTKDEYSAFIKPICYELEKKGFEITTDKASSELEISLWANVRSKRNMNWGGWVLGIWPFVGLFHDVSCIECFVKVKKGNEVVFKDNVKQYGREGALFSDFKGGRNKIIRKTMKRAFTKAIKKFTIMYN